MEGEVEKNREDGTGGEKSREDEKYGRGNREVWDGWRDINK